MLGWEGCMDQVQQTISVNVHGLLVLSTNANERVAACFMVVGSRRTAWHAQCFRPNSVTLTIAKIAAVPSTQMNSVATQEMNCTHITGQAGQGQLCAADKTASDA
jgi:hypothetical protein